MSLTLFLTLSAFVGSVSLVSARLEPRRPPQFIRPDHPASWSSTFRDILFFSALAAPVLLFFAVWAVNAVNIPFQDDIDAVLESTATLAKGPVSLRQFWSALSKQDDERRIVVVRLVAWLVYRATGSVDFRAIAFAGLCAYLVFLRLIFGWFRAQRDLPMALLLPVPYLLFSHFNYAALYQAMVPLQHIGVYVWGFASIWLVAGDTRTGVIEGAAMGILAIYSDVTGIFVGPVVAVMLLARRQWTAAAWWVLLFGLVTAFYFNGLTVPDFRPTFAENLASWPNMLWIAIAMPGMMADVFLVGSDTSRLVCATVAGMASLALVGVSAFDFGRKLRRDKRSLGPGEWWLAGCVLFLLITFCTFAFGRAAYGADSILLSRYKHMFTFWGILNYLLLLKLPFFRRLFNRHLIVLQAGALVYFGGSYFQTWGDMLYMRKTIQADAYGWTKNREFPSAPIYLAVKQAVDSIFENALKTDIYQFPSFPFEDMSGLAVRGWSEVTVQEAGFIIVGADAPALRCSPEDGIYLIIHSDDETHILPMRLHRRSFLSFLRTGHYYAGYCESMPMLRQYLCKNKRYKLTLGVINGPDRYLLATGKEVTGSGDRGISMRGLRRRGFCPSSLHVQCRRSRRSAGV